MRVRDRAVGQGLDRSARNHGRSARILRDLRGDCFPRLYAAASLKHVEVGTVEHQPIAVFRGFMPRPH